jgi:hypothetical protein
MAIKQGSEPIVFINIGWMKHYQGPNDPDDVFHPGHFKYFQGSRRHLTAHESWNFAKRNGRVYGYIPNSVGVNFAKLGGSQSDRKLTGVLVVFMARDPDSDQLLVVGWYRNATILGTIVKRQYEFSPGDVQDVDIRTMASAADATCLPVGSRHIAVPTAQKTPGGVGQSPVWYGQAFPGLVAEVRSAVDSTPRKSPRLHRAGPRPGAGGGWPRKPNIERNRAVEDAAMRLALNRFDRTQDVSDKNYGWDVEAYDSHGKIYIEVKGLSGTAVSVELTRKEYEQMEQLGERYVLFVVTQALTKRPRTRTFRLRVERSGPGLLRWLSESGERLKVRPVVAARAFL